MTTQPPADRSQTNPTPIVHGARWGRGFLGYVIGCFAGGLIGWLIDSALTSEPYAGVRIGVFVGGLCGAMLGGGNGWLGVGMMLCIMLCSAAGVGLCLWIFGPDSYMTFLGGIAGAFLGLAFAAVGAAVVLQKRKQPGSLGAGTE